MIYENYPNWDINIKEGTINTKNNSNGRINNNGYIQVGHNGETLHRIIWKCVNGEIPEGYDIHHIDGNPLNNSIYNLELIEHKEHISKHKSGITFSSEHKKKLSESHKGKQSWIKGKHHNDKTKLLLSNINKGNNYALGYKHTEEAKIQMSIKHSKKVGQYKDNILINIYDSVKDCSKDGFHPPSVAKCCRNVYGKNKNMYKDYIWKYI